jgi:hypothetical protein
MADDAVPIPLDLKIREYAFQLQDPSLSKLHEQAAKAFWESIEKNGERRNGALHQYLTLELMPSTGSYRDGTLHVDFAIIPDTTFCRPSVASKGEERGAAQKDRG